MIKKLFQSDRRERRHQRLRKRVFGTAQKPRLCVFRSQMHMYAQLIDDNASKTLVSASSLEEIKLPETRQAEPAAEKQEKGKKKGAKAPAESTLNKPSLLATAVGEIIAKKALEKGITEVVFDRGGFQFHGRVKALAEGARKAGLKF